MSLITLAPVWNEMNQQQVYRLLLEGMSYPGRVVDLRPALGDAPAEIGILAALVDEEVTYADPQNRIAALDRQLLAARVADISLADYVLHDAALPPTIGYTPKRGTLYRPDSSATLILVGEHIGALKVEGSLQLRLTGPGIQNSTDVFLSGFDVAWLEQRREWNNNFPLGVDLFLCDMDHAAGIPRTCHVEVIKD